MLNFGTSPLVRNCVFEVPDAPADIEAVCNGDSTARFEDCLFVSRATTRLFSQAMVVRDSDITISNSEFAMFDSSWRSGAIWVASGTLMLDGCRFHDNASDYEGGAIAVDGSGTLVIRATSFEENHSKLEGGALYTRGGFVRIGDSAFTRNSSQAGGAISADYGSSVEITSSVFLEKTAVGSIVPAGGAFRGLGAELQIVGSIFDDNSADSPLGVALSPSFAEVRRCSVPRFSTTWRWVMGPRAVACT